MKTDGMREDKEMGKVRSKRARRGGGGVETGCALDIAGLNYWMR